MYHVGGPPRRHRVRVSSWGFLCSRFVIRSLSETLRLIVWLKLTRLVWRLSQLAGLAGAGALPDLQPNHVSVRKSETIRFYRTWIFHLSENKDDTRRVVHPARIITPSLLPVPTHANMSHVDDSTFRRKSSLSVSVAIGCLEDEDHDVVWPALSFSELSTKRARGKGSVETYCVARLRYEIGSIDDSGDAALEKNDADFLATWTLQKSSNLCSLVLKENRGCESWRDFL
jgi:hypothetical protein